MPIKPIETWYDGHKFRSRLEARWAIFFDALDIRYEYETQGYDLGPPFGRYLPGFWLPRLEIWVEIKGKEPSRAEIDRVAALADGTGHAAYIFFGTPWPIGRCGPNSDPSWGVGPSAHVYYPGYTYKHGYSWAECERCGLLEPLFEGGRHRQSCRECDAPGHAFRADSPRLVSAYVAARSARFERGQSGRGVRVS
jgi:hypothetical protein